MYDEWMKKKFNMCFLIYSRITNRDFMEVLLHWKLAASTHMLSKQKNNALDSGKVELVSLI